MTQVDGKGQIVCPESTIESANRRNFIRKAAISAAAMGIGGAALGHNLVSTSYASADAPLTGSCATGVGVTGTTCSGAGVRGAASCGTGVQGCSTSGKGIYGVTSSGPAAVSGLVKSKTGKGVCGLAYILCGCSIAANEACQVGVQGTVEFVHLTCGEFGVPRIVNYGSGIGVQGIAGVGYGVVGKSINYMCGKNTRGSGIGVFGCSGSGLGVWGTSDTSAGVAGSSLCGIGVCGSSVESYGVKGLGGKVGVYGSSVCLNAPGVKGVSTDGTGVCGSSTSGFGLSGSSGSLVGVFGGSTSGTGVYASALCKVAVPLVAHGHACQTSNIQEWQRSSSTLSAVNKNGWFGIGKTCPSHAVDVSGSVFAAATCCTCNACNVGVQGSSKVGGAGVRGIGGSSSHPGVGVVGWGYLSGVSGRGCGPCGVGVIASASCKTGLPIFVYGAPGQTGPLQKWASSCGTPLSVVSSSGYIGVGVTSPQRKVCVSGRMHASCGIGIGTQIINTSFALNGSMSARAKIVKSSYSMTVTDFAIIANSTSAITITLPAANSGGSFGCCIGGGMIIFIKNASTGSVTVTPNGTDTIEGASSSSPKVLSKQYDSLQLISNGSDEWFLVGNSIGDAFTS
jgi:hypothetical protein